jgi:hypothetical protein
MAQPISLEFSNCARVAIVKRYRGVSAGASTAEIIRDVVDR